MFEIVEFKEFILGAGGIEALKGSIVLVASPVLAGLGAYLANKVFGRKSKEQIQKLEKLVLLSMDELEYMRAIEAEHIRNNKEVHGTGFERQMRQNARVFANRASTQRFSPSQIAVIRSKYKK
ncbi:hypothetical protein VCHA53O466_50068 [Vibrio chagasii]|nr:hypothetical protein VCHA53O466_50068 [Vibrio chagasii]